MVSISHYEKIWGFDDGICIKNAKENESGNFHIKNMTKLMLQMAMAFISN